MRVLSGIQPTGTLHLGNYFGAVKNWVELQAQYESIVMIVDLHALTQPQEPDVLRKNIFQMAVDILAAGIDPKRTIFFIQSHVKEHAELAWILDTITPIGELERMTQYKDKSKRLGEETNAGLFTYPVLQAADILLYQTDIVPVGKDQEQHLEFARTIARKFNHRFGKTFKEPKALIPKVGAKIMSVADPSKKMSKSLGPNHYIGLFEAPDDISKKIKTAVTDTNKEIKFAESKSGISNLLTILSLVTSQAIPEIEKEWKGKGYAEFKAHVAEKVIQFTEPFRIRQQELSGEKQRIEQILKEGAQRAQKIAEETMKKVRMNVGLLES
jgi:tryptophanyl-tRNA synthetase